MPLLPEVGGPPTQAQERHVRHVTRDVMLGLASRFPKLQRFFLDAVELVAAVVGSSASELARVLESNFLSF